METIQKIIEITEAKTAAEKERTAELEKLSEHLEKIQGLITGCQTREKGNDIEDIRRIVMSDEKEGMKRVHERVDSILERVNGISERVAKIETSDTYQEKGLEKSETRIYDIALKVAALAATGIGGAIAMKYLGE